MAMSFASLSPNSGGTSGGTSIVMNGDGFLEEITFTQLSKSGSLALASNDKLYAWGNNYNGQLGNNSNTNSSVPVEVDMSGVLSGKTITAIAAGNNHTLALTTEGKVYAWGSNNCGQLGNNSTTQSLIPVAVDTSGILSGKSITAIATGNSFSLALDTEGKVYAWGYNASGQLGNNSTTSSSIPVAVDTSGILSGKSITAIAGNYNHALALDDEGKVYAWGNNGRGQLGNNSTTQSLIPVAVDVSGVLAGKTITAIAAGMQFSLGVSTEGNFYSWGENSSGQLGTDSVHGLSLIPVRADTTGVLTGKTITSIITGSEHTLVLTSEGKVYAWGRNADGQLGNNSTTNSSIPVAVDTSGVLSEKIITSIAAGTSHSLVLDTEGKIHTWGNNYSGQLGNGFNGDSILNPTAVDTGGVLSGKTITKIESKFHHSLALDDEGKVYAWGSNNSGQLGNNSTTNSSIPVAVDTSGVLSGKTITSIAAGIRNSYSEDIHSLALDDEGKVYAWGYNYFGQLGNNSTTNSLIPVAVDTSGVLSGKTITAIAGGASHSLALDDEGKVYAWGSNSDGQLGNNSTTQSLIPVAVDTSGVLSGKTITAIAAGAYCSLALDDEGKVYAWGSNSDGQLGNNSTTKSLIPVAVDVSGVLSGKTITAIAAGGWNVLALSTEGKVYAWGFNYYGQLGNNSTSQSLVPVPVYTSGVLSGKTITKISAGIYHSLALSADGQIYAWGNNFNGQLGNNSKTNSSTPIMTNMSDVLAGKTITSLTAGIDYSLALDDEGKVYAWGKNNYGQTGTYDFYKMFSVKSEKQIVSVGFGSTSAPSLGKTLVLNSANQLEVITPAHSAGLVDLILTNNFGEQVIVADAYTYQTEVIATPIPTSTPVPTPASTNDNEDEDDENCAAQKPSPPTLVNVQRLSLTEAMVFWSQGNGEVTHWYLVYEKKGGDGNKKITISNASVREFKIENLDASTDYVFTVIQVNGCSESDASNVFDLESTTKNVVKPVVNVKIDKTKLKSEDIMKNKTEAAQTKTKEQKPAAAEKAKEITADEVKTKENKDSTKFIKNVQVQITSLVKKSWTIVVKNVQNVFSNLKKTIWSWFK